MGLDSSDSEYDFSDESISASLDEDALLSLIERRIKSNRKCASIILELEKKEERTLGNMEIAFIENYYIDIALKTWLDRSLKSAQKSINRDQVSPEDLNAILKQLASSIQVISDLAKDKEMLGKWSQPDRLGVIIAQPDLFPKDLSADTLKKFKHRCRDILLQKCAEGIDQNDRGSILLKTLGEFLLQVNIDANREEFLDRVKHRDFIMKETIPGNEFLQRLVSVSHNLLTSLSPEMITNLTISVLKLQKSDWTSGFSIMIKDTCRQLLLQPETTVKLLTEKGSQQIIEARGTAITCSRIIEKLIQLKRKNPNVGELRIVCTTALHIDCNLDQKIWHGTNVVVVTDNLYVISNGKSNRCWDVSGLDGKGHLSTTAESGREPGEDAQPGNQTYIYKFS